LEELLKRNSLNPWWVHFVPIQIYAFSSSTNNIRGEHEPPAVGMHFAHRDHQVSAEKWAPELATLPTDAA
jgi:hypothetical protein